MPLHGSLVGDLAKISRLQEQVSQYEDTLIAFVLARSSSDALRECLVEQAIMYLDAWNPPDPVAAQWYRDAVAAGYSVSKPWCLVREA